MRRPGTRSKLSDAVAKTPEQWHKYYHGLRRSYEDCWRCGRARAICRSKVSYDDPEEAWVEARRLNELFEYERMLYPYWCRYCDKRHLTDTAGSKGTRARRVERARRKWLIAKRMEEA